MTVTWPDVPTHPAGLDTDRNVLHFRVNNSYAFSALKLSTESEFLTNALPHLLSKIKKYIDLIITSVLLHVDIILRLRCIVLPAYISRGWLASNIPRKSENPNISGDKSNKQYTWYDFSVSVHLGN